MVPVLQITKTFPSAPPLYVEAGLVPSLVPLVFAARLPAEGVTVLQVWADVPV
jgi:hypothetical protein